MLKTDTSEYEMAKLSCEEMVEEHGIVKGIVEYYKMLLGFGEYSPSKGGSE